MFDTIVMTLTPNTMSEKFKEYTAMNEENLKASSGQAKGTNPMGNIAGFTNGSKEKEIGNIRSANNEEDCVNIKPNYHLLGMPFSHWTSHIRISENNTKPFSFSGIIEESLFNNQELFPWLLKYLPIFNANNYVWNAGDVKQFYVRTMQTSLNVGTSTLSSLSGVIFFIGTREKLLGIQEF
jgi:hypothetical protein